MLFVPDVRVAPPAMVEVDGGLVHIGEDDGLASERPSFVARVAPFALDVREVSTTEFARFVGETGYVTDAERFGDGSVLALPDGGWRLVAGAHWRFPQGPAGLAARADHPVTQVSWRDASAYCSHRSARLPTEIEWEHAARNGNDDRTRYPWGDALWVDAEPRANVWQGPFPTENHRLDGYLGTAPVGSFPPTPLGLYDLVGNVWEWTSSVFVPYAERDDEAPGDPLAERVLRGGSYLCEASVCHGYRVSARMGATPESALEHVGFRCARTADAL